MVEEFDTAEHEGPEHPWSACLPGQELVPAYLVSRYAAQYRVIVEVLLAEQDTSLTGLSYDEVAAAVRAHLAQRVPINAVATLMDLRRSCTWTRGWSNSNAGRWSSADRNRCAPAKTSCAAAIGTSSRRSPLGWTASGRRLTTPRRPRAISPGTLCNPRSAGLLRRRHSISTARWSDVRDKHVEAIGHKDVARGTSRLISQGRAHWLVDMRKRRGLTQRDVAQAMGVTVGRVSQIENGELPASTSWTATSPPSEASSKSSPTSVTNSSKSVKHRR